MTLLPAADVGLPLLQSSVLPAGFVHGFTVRDTGGATPGSFNLALSWGNQPDQVAANRRRLLAALGGDHLYLARQVHGAEVVRVGEGDSPGTVGAARADAIVTDRPGAAIGVFVADCVPVLLADPDTGACAAVHAGWRGVVAQVVSAAVRQMGAAYGTRAASLRAALGPAIGRCCFEVGPEVVTAFAGIPGLELSEVVNQQPGARPYIDLRRTLLRELAALGVPAAQIDEGVECTRCDPQGRFFSFRREGRVGQQLAVIMRRPGPPPPPLTFP
jgi:polyphenol oxidase